MKLLIIKANQLGDNIVFLPVVRELVSRLGANSVQLLTSPAAAALYEGILPADSLWIEPTQSLRRAWKRPWELARLTARARSFEADAVLVAFDQGNVARLLAWMSGAPVRAGVDHPSTRVNSCLTHRVDFDPTEPMPVRDWTAMRLMLDMLGVVGRDAVAEAPPRPSLRHLLIDGRKPTREARRIFIHPGASRPYKRWPLERFTELANRLSEGFEVLWSESSEEPCPAQLSPEVQRVPQAGIGDLVTQLAGCGLMIGNNSGPMNVAVAVGTPTLIFNGPSPRCWDPIWNPRRHRLLRVEKLACQPCDSAAGPQDRCTNVHERMACMDRWTVDATTDAANEHWLECWGSMPVPDEFLHPLPPLCAPIL